ncbi:MAG: hypothetical protein JWO94_2955 [Verrucomicrobiaceae bacterium]|nr:hypothetical protein [Verrucomicrobiaceae bacterium]
MPALPGIGLLTEQLAIAAMPGFQGVVIVHATIVAGERNKRIAGKAPFFQRIEHHAGAVIQLLNIVTIQARLAFAAKLRRAFLTQQIDPQGNAITLTYDNQFRITAQGPLESDRLPPSGQRRCDQLRLRCRWACGLHYWVRRLYLTFSYDDLDRPARVTFPDGTCAETTYQFLDLHTLRDRLGAYHQLHLQQP